MRPTDRSAVRTGVAISLALHAFAAAGVIGVAPALKAPLAAPVIVARIVSPQVTHSLDTRPAEFASSKPDHKQVEKKIALQPKAPASVAAIPIEAPPADAPAADAAPAVASNAVPKPLAVSEPAVLSAPVFNASYLENPVPAYPSVSRRLGEQGKVVLRVLVNARGTPDAVELRASSGHPRLDDAAQDTVRHWKFVPARLGAEPCAAWVLIPISFRLEG